MDTEFLVHRWFGEGVVCSTHCLLLLFAETATRLDKNSLDILPISLFIPLPGEEKRYLIVEYIIGPQFLV